jgi:hypothetical protein
MFYLMLDILLPVVHIVVIFYKDEVKFENFHYR